MEGPRAARISELPLVEKLSNAVFKGAEDEAGQSMFEQFPELFSVENIENIRVILEDGIPVSNMNYVIRPVSIHGCTIKVASLGAVATLKEYRGKGYATTLLNDCIARMRHQGVHILLISGDRRLYRNVGSMPAGVTYVFSIDENTSLKSDSRSLERYSIREINMEKCEEGDFIKFARLYRSENVRFIRKYDEFKQLLLSRKHLPRITSMKKVIALDDKNEFAAYMYLAVNGKNASIYDCAGSRELLLKTCIKLIGENVFETVRGRLLPYHKQAIELCKASNIKLDKKRLVGTIKIIDFVGLMNALRQYFYEIYNSSFVDEIEFISDENGAGFKQGSKKCILTCKETLNDLIFGGRDLCKEDFVWEDEDNSCFPETDYEKFIGFFRQVFPIPFIDPDNLNYV
jgi:GNAT superfamily N-acetyltransferase